MIPPRATHAVVVSLFTVTVFVSALLLFSVQPLFAKMVLPVLGGAPSVWAVALCFFQAALVAGYAYAHLLTSRVPSRYSGIVHVLIMCAAAAALPIGLPRAWHDPPSGDPYFWQLGLFAAGVGAPFIVVAANAPLLQAWLARTSHPDRRDPYFLYGASNLGSLVALLAYPFVFEPAFGLTALGRIWSVGFVALGLAIAVCFWSVRRSGTTPEMSGAPEPTSNSSLPTSRVSPWSRRLKWMGLALVPSALLTAFTTHVSTDVASAPLLWVIPLALYLLTFVLVFRERPFTFAPIALVIAGEVFLACQWVNDRYFESNPHTVWFIGIGAAAAAVFGVAYYFTRSSRLVWLRAAHVVAVVVALLELSQVKHNGWTVSAIIDVSAFVLAAMVAHRTLYDARPPARELTTFYLLMSIGGALGGAFSAIIAPRIFREVFEYPILLALTMACRPGMRVRSVRDWLTLALIFAAGIALIRLGPGIASRHEWTFGDYGQTMAIAAVFALGVLVCFRRPPRQLVFVSLLCGAVIALGSTVNRRDAWTKARSYFGVYRVFESEDHQFNVLTHGTTLHGAQRVRSEEGAPVADTTPGTYYYPASPMALTIDMVRARLDGEERKGRYGIVGVGSGSLSCYSEKGETWRFFDIDPVIVGIASDPRNFTYLSACQPHPDIVIGDARRSLSKEAADSFDLIIVDAFSSDAVPVHLLTAEAIRMYAQKLTPSGIVLLHTSNRYLDLDAVLGATIPLVPELHGVLLSDDEADGSYAESNSTVGVFSKSEAAIAPFKALSTAVPLARGVMRGWTDDYSDVLHPFLAKLRE